MDPAQPDRLEGDQEEVTFTDAQRVLRCSPHHDDWADLDWYGEDGVDRGRAVVYRDVTRAAPVPDVPWLLMEPVSHEIRRRSLKITQFYPHIPITLIITPKYPQQANSLLTYNTFENNKCRYCNLKVLKYVVSTSDALKVNKMNKKVFTALDVIEQMPKDLKTRQVHELLHKVGAKRELFAMGHDTNKLGPIEFDEIHVISTPVSVVVLA
ncbi:hypothetical protein LguiA_005298 [Lonicera macranthoides]